MPRWVADQLADAVRVAARVPTGSGTAATLFRDWFDPALPGADASLRSRLRPLPGVYRAAHAGTARTHPDGTTLVDRHDVVGTDGWWRTWGRHWTPPRTRPGSVRVLCTPRPERAAEVVRAVTAALLPTDTPWSLSCATSVRRLRRRASVVLDLPTADDLPDGLLERLLPHLRAEVPPLCLPLAPGIALAAYPDTGAGFGEHRCHLIALAVRRVGPGVTTDVALAAIADVLAAHGVDPAAPWR